MNVLEKIRRYKQDEITVLKASISTQKFKTEALGSAPTRGFHQALIKAAQTGPALIAEVKKASPSKGLIREDFNPVEIAKAYEAGGAACLSVLTDAPSFMGSLDYLADIRRAVSLPLLRKDFMLEPIQVFEARAAGADAILIIMAMVDDKEAKALMRAAKQMGMDALVETHDAAEMTRALALGAKLIGINNRDLKTFYTSLDTFKTLAKSAPPDVTLVAESGIFTADDILDLASYGAGAFLVGESLMRQNDVTLATQRLLGQTP